MTYNDSRSSAQAHTSSGNPAVRRVASSASAIRTELPPTGRPDMAMEAMSP
ncbi:hypothetical protein QTS76_01425 [Micromonospora sp. b486]|nr:MULTISPECIES: hypothetical protein [unclassified Micromonospora]MBU8855762.1 hypothetical protein [Micromonospora sp. WMMB482]MDM4777937.1 hypothetical protein [Micromonospora sp. b486]